MGNASPDVVEVDALVIGERPHLLMHRGNGGGVHLRRMIQEHRDASGIEHSDPRRVR